MTHTLLLLAALVVQLVAPGEWWHQYVQPIPQRANVRYNLHCLKVDHIEALARYGADNRWDKFRGVVEDHRSACYVKPGKNIARLKQPVTDVIRSHKTGLLVQVWRVEDVLTGLVTYVIMWMGKSPPGPQPDA